MTFIERNGNPRAVSAPVGQSLLEIARANDIDIEGTCGGCMSCATCHVIVADEWYRKLRAKEVQEIDMLDLAWGLTPTSRLGCQIVMTEALDGLVVTLAEER